MIPRPLRDGRPDPAVRALSRRKYPAAGLWSGHGRTSPQGVRDEVNGFFPAGSFALSGMRDQLGLERPTIVRHVEWRISCAIGTNITVSQDTARVARGEAEDFTATRHPVCAPCPLPCNTANGVVALTHWLIAFGNQQYPDDEVLLPETVMGHVDNGCITGFDGPADMVARIKAHYTRVTKTLNLEPWIVHSWHAEINSGCSYSINGAQQP